MYRTRGGYSHDEIDKAGLRLVELIQQELNAQLENAAEIADAKLFYSVQGEAGGYTASMPGYRIPVPQGRRVIVHIRTAEPANAGFTRSFGIEVPRDCGIDDDLIIRGLEKKDAFEARITLLLPAIKSALRMRLAIWVQKVVAELIDDLSKLARESLRNKGY